MKFRTLAAASAAASLATTLVTLAPVAHAADPVQLYVANAYSYDADHAITVTVCVDGSPLTNSATRDVDGPFPVAAGDHDLVVLPGADAACDSDIGNEEFVATVSVPQTQQATLLLSWPADREGMVATVLPDDLSCAPAGQGRIVVRNGASIYYHDVPDPDLDWRGVLPGQAAESLLIGDIPSTGQAAAVLPAGDYTNTRAVAADTTDPTQVDTEGGTLDPGVVIVHYLYGGNDGATGYFSDQYQVGECEAPSTTTTTTLAPTTTTLPPVPPAAIPVRATPRYTG